MTLGRKVDGLRVVRDGLKSGDVVIVSGLQRVRPGTAVSPTLQTMGATDTEAALRSARVPETAVATEAARNALSLKGGANTSENTAKPR